MLDYWIQNGDAFYLKLQKDYNVKNVEETLNYLNELFDTIFRRDGSLTIFSRTFFSALNIKNLEDLILKVQKSFSNYKESKNKACIICGRDGAGTGKGWFYPFIITKDKFPHIYPNAKIAAITFCRDCALRSLLAYHNVFFSAQNDYLTFVLFFSDNAESLMYILEKIKREEAAEYYFNMKSLDKVYFPYEYLAVLLDAMTYRIEREELFKRSLGGIVFGLPIGKSKKKIFDYAEVVTRLNDVIRAFFNFRYRMEKKFGASGTNYFKVLFQSLRRDPWQDRGDFIDRNQFFRYIIRYGEINWKIAENILFYNIRAERRGYPPPYFTDFIISVLEVFNMSEKELFEKVSNMGYSLGKSLLQTEKDPKKAKQLAFELRRKRKLEEFLDELNLIQLHAETTIDDRPFRENEKLFPKLKVFFLIGFANAIFSKEKS